MIRYISLALCCVVWADVARGDSPFPAHRVAGNTYYVGSHELASYLITTPEGHFLINSSFEETVPLIRGAVESLGFKNVKVYDSSWLGYAARLDAPVERETFFNVGAMNGRLASMQRKIEELEAMINDLHSSHTAKLACPAGKVC